MRVERLWLTDFRNYTAAELAPAPGLTAIVGANGEGKTNVLEAIAYLATLSSFRGAPGEALVRVGCAAAVVRSQLRSVDAASVANGRVREALVEAEL
ncbi:MAG TPA: AAA family ATPase, partial [Acidimicrobiales bacterium]|nr:AAA family ATPase [Acidimicrobiales bacterium]